MSVLSNIVAAHPLQESPYNLIAYTRPDGNGTPLYRVAEEAKEMGAPEALKRAFERFGARCFHCQEPLPPQKLSQHCNRDHLRPLKLGGRSYLHNLVVTCGSCNRRKGAKDIVTFAPERGAEYLKALDDHIMRCLGALRSS